MSLVPATSPRYHAPKADQISNILLKDENHSCSQQECAQARQKVVAEHVNKLFIQHFDDKNSNQNEGAIKLSNALCNGQGVLQFSVTIDTFIVKQGGHEVARIVDKELAQALIQGVKEACNHHTSRNVEGEKEEEEERIENDEGDKSDSGSKMGGSISSYLSTSSPSVNYDTNSHPKNSVGNGGSDNSSSISFDLQSQPKPSTRVITRLFTVAEGIKNVGKGLMNMRCFGRSSDESGEYKPVPGKDNHQSHPGSESSKGSRLSSVMTSIGAGAQGMGSSGDVKGALGGLSNPFSRESQRPVASSFQGISILAATPAQRAAHQNVIHTGIAWLKEENKDRLQTEGIMRIASEQPKREALQEALKQPQCQIEDTADVHEVMGAVKDSVLKAYGPLVGFTLQQFKEYRAIGTNPGEELSNKQTGWLKNELNDLLRNKEDQTVFKQYVHLLKQISELSELNKMDAKNLGALFGPVFSGNVELVNLMQVTLLATQMAELMIEHVNEIFPDEEGSKDDSAVHFAVLGDLEKDNGAFDPAVVDQIKEVLKEGVDLQLDKVEKEPLIFDPPTFAYLDNDLSQNVPRVSKWLGQFFKGSVSSSELAQNLNTNTGEL